MLIAIFVLGIMLSVSSSLNVTAQDNSDLAIRYTFKCFNDTGNTQHVTKNDAIGLEVTNRVTHQLLTRVFAIFLREKLEYENIFIVPIQTNLSGISDEFNRMIKTFDLIRYHPNLSNTLMINLEVWTPVKMHSYVPETIIEAGNSLPYGRFGWFVHASLFSNYTNTITLNFNIFLSPSNSLYESFIISEQNLNKLRNSPGSQFYESPQCKYLLCVTLLAGYMEDTLFVKKQIEYTKAFVNVLWLGSRFKSMIDSLLKTYETESHNGNKFIILHWYPSDVIGDPAAYVQINMPHCEQSEVLEQDLCKYEYTPILKYFAKNLERDAYLVNMLRDFKLEEFQLRNLTHTLNINSPNTANTMEQMYNEAACDWLKRNLVGKDWNARNLKLSIGAIMHAKLSKAVDTAITAISKSSILKNYNLVSAKHDDLCKADMAMKAMIQYFNNEDKFLGVLGPACSETVEPIAGISRHMRMVVISYSAEGVTFVNRETYPYFFRTIGSNRQYEDVYIALMKHLGWRRVAALSEDGQKYTDYISHMETALKQNNFELIMNKKFLSDVTATEMNKCLMDLKQRHARIIIADIHNKNVFLALCEAFKLKMTAIDGYVWFLPSWIAEDWNYNKIADEFSGICSEEQLKRAFNGHFTLLHTPFGNPQAVMQEEKTVATWLNEYQLRNNTISNYIGFAYDAVWTFALAADKLFNKSSKFYDALDNFETINIFKDIIWETDFEGLSGRVRFGEGGSRITDIDIMQWNNTDYVKVGKFVPNIVGAGRNLRAKGGALLLDDKSIDWLAGKNQGDGMFDCNFAIIAQMLNENCERAAFIFTSIMCFFTVLVVSLISFWFWKRRYDSKLEGAAKVMKNFGIDLLSPSRSKQNTLDKWELPKENVVINRRLGEGAFGMVYGGEAQIGSQNWTAVAVKTLKAGASTEDRLDFLSEAEAMKRFNHINIVKLLGVCLQSEPIYTIMEYMLYGDLKTYLLARRHLVNQKLNDESDISPKRLTMYALDVARGLHYLSQQKYVHRDLACRNCLVNAERVVKLGDFGMSRPTFGQDYYRFNRKGMLPVRWMAPEALALGYFTPASDVWALGVVVFEIITFGSFPFQGLTNNQVLEHVKAGKTLQIPNGVKPQLEGLIKACWSQDPKKRPTASEVADYISKYPRLLAPCLDFPGASVEMVETDNEDLEVLPQFRRISPIRLNTTLDILPQTNDPNNFQNFDDFIPGIGMPLNEQIAVDHSNDSNSPITPDGYSIMAPLLMNQLNDNNDTRARTFSIQQTPI